MKNLEKIKRRFLKDNLPTRLGGLACNLARLKSFSQIPGNQKAVRDLIEESKFFIEWTAPMASLDVQEELVNLQIQLALENYLKAKKDTIKFADEWSKKILKLSGLLKND